MKQKQDDLDLDFIGGGRPLTREDEIAISNYLSTYNAMHSQKVIKAKRAVRVITSQPARKERRKVVA